MTDTTAVELATELTLAWLSNPSTRVDADDVQAFVTAVAETLDGLIAAPAVPQTEDPVSSDHAPAVGVRKSLASRDHIISMIDGRPYKTLRRHLSAHGLTPDAYRARYGLRTDYPMVAPAYSESRRETAKRLGLGRKPADAAAVAKAATPGRKAAASTRQAAPRADAAEPETTASVRPEAERTSKVRARRSAADAKAAAKKHLSG